MVGMRGSAMAGDKNSRHDAKARAADGDRIIHRIGESLTGRAPPRRSGEQLRRNGGTSDAERGPAAVRWRVSYPHWRVRLSNRACGNAAWVSNLMGGMGLRRGLDSVRSSSRISRFEGRPVRIPHQMQRPGKETAIILGLADIDNAGID